MARLRSVFDSLYRLLASKVFMSSVVSLYVGVGTLMAWKMLGRPVAGADDANIFFVYARNFIHGHGIVYNAGGEHVEGFTSVLYFALCSVAFACSASPEIVLAAFNLAFSISACILVVYVISAFADESRLPISNRFLLFVGYLLWILFNPCYFSWLTVSLMDSAIYSLLLAVGYAYLARCIVACPDKMPDDSWKLGIILLLTILVRPEGVVWAALFCAGYACIRWQRETSARANLKKLWIPLAVLLAAPAALTIFRIAYFGYPLPNTYYAKVSASMAATLADGWEYFTRFVCFYGILSVLPLCVLIAWIVSSAFGKKPNTKVLALAVLTAAFLLVGFVLPVLEGGDHFNAFRMYQPIYPLLFLPMALLLLIRPSNSDIDPHPSVIVLRKDGAPSSQYLRAESIVLAPSIHKTASQTIYAGILVSLIALMYFNSWGVFEASNRPSGLIADQRMRMLAEFSIASDERVNGLRLRQLFQPEMPTIGFGSAGGIAYGYQGTVYDLMGLNNARMAHADAVKSGPKGHESFNKAMFYSLSPDLLMPRAAAAEDSVDLASVESYYSDPRSWDNRIFKGLFNDNRFRASYVFALFRDESHPAYLCYGYFSKAYILKLSGDKRVRLSFPSQ